MNVLHLHAAKTTSGLLDYNDCIYITQSPKPAPVPACALINCTAILHNCDVPATCQPQIHSDTRQNFSNKRQVCKVAVMSSLASANLHTIPSELRKLIVSYLAPSPHYLRPGCKRDLKNANLAHSCLREWVPEYMFRDMVLPIYVDIKMSSRLELFAVHPRNMELSRHVKHIHVQVPPALRWDNNVEDPFDSVELDHRRRFCKRLGVDNIDEMTTEQFQRMINHYELMVEPFTDSRRWYILFQAANNSWRRIFRYFGNLTTISVGKFWIVDQPLPTCAANLMAQHDVVDCVVDPPYVEDYTINQAWASSVVLMTASTTVRTLHLTLANTDNPDSHATVNRLLNLSYLLTPLSSRLSGITTLNLTLGGLCGTHGAQDEFGPTGSAASARYCKKLLNALTGLRHLELYDELRPDDDIMFTDLSITDLQEHILEWILPGLVLKQLRTLHLCKFELESAALVPMFTGRWPLLEKIVFENCGLQMHGIDDNEDLLQGSVGNKERNNPWENHLRGQSWVESCHALLERHPGLRIELIHPSSRLGTLMDHHIHPDNVQKLGQIPGVTLDV